MAMHKKKVGKIESRQKWKLRHFNTWLAGVKPFCRFEFKVNHTACAIAAGNLFCGSPFVFQIFVSFVFGASVWI